jgi:hypothetical protein
VATHEASDVKAAGMPVPSRERERVPDTSRRLTGTESIIQEKRKWQIRPAFRRRTGLSW